LCIWEGVKPALEPWKLVNGVRTQEALASTKLKERDWGTDSGMSSGFESLKGDFDHGKEGAFYRHGKDGT
jgi:hypothetical protein